MRREGVAPIREDASMPRRLVWGLTALAVGIVIPAPARSDPASDGPPKIHVAGIDRSVDAGGAGPTEIPTLVRAGSDRRSNQGGAAGPSSRERGGPLAPVISEPAFDGVQDLEEVSPGDPTGAVGIDYHLAAVNVHMAFYERTGAELEPPRSLTSLDTALPAAAESFDPKVVYDPYRPHFLLVYLSATATKSFISLVVIPEGSEDTTSEWCVLHMSGDQVGGNGKQFADYPMIGFTEDRVTLTTNQFNFSNAPAIGGFQYAQVVSIRKTPLYDCSVPVVPIKVFSRDQTKDPDGSRAFTIVPTVSFGGAPTVQFMASMDFNGSSGKLILWRLKVVNGVLRLARAHIAGGPMTYPRWGRQCGNTSGLNSKWDTGDVRLTTAFWDGDLGRLYTATARDGNIGGGAAESVIRWWEVDPTSALRNSDVTRTGIVGAVARDLAWPSISTDADGKVWINYARAGAGECLAAYASLIQQGATAAASVLIMPGSGRYEYGPGVERWGDYTAITRDPVTPTEMATYGAYPFDDGQGGDQTDLWQQVIASVADA
jgi:hypothetical protein